MMLIGMLHHRKDPRTVIKAYAYAVVAKAEGAEMIYFAPKGVNFEKETIKGFMYENGGWIEKEVRFPDVIYNTGSPEKLLPSANIINQLKQRKIPFTTHSIGNKQSIYERLKEAGDFASYLIPTEVVTLPRHFFEFLYDYHKIIFKPLNGRKGKGIVLVESFQDHYKVLQGTDEQFWSTKELRDFVSIKLREEQYIVQPFISCQTKSGHAFDFRLHVQKNGEGNWVITAIYPRIGPTGSIVANINNGGATNYLEPFLKQEFDEDYYDIKRYLEQFALSLANHLDELQQVKFGETIDELGMDVALDEFGKIWIFEVNWRPGCPPAFYLELDVVKNMIEYAMFLAKKSKVNN
ncbi:YheC/YheD family protein [Bacillus sp. MRMR6]|uniref:YheC/YheD family endospore coat-associated protein n=1 Tax=Bacillus sp. MRMR6 TaxID=1928617 RepID=UPI000951364A|nr:YheC/YheD family protein [Bacillus sp. MRMR6]OLS36481.1 alpha-L-glutamate ligase [Bacillus sp. MRMR6]